MLSFTLSVALVTLAALLVFGPPAKESRGIIAVLVLLPSVSAGAVAALMASRRSVYRMGFARGALVGLASLVVFSLTMAGAGCHADLWTECLLKSLTLFGFVTGVPVVVVSGLVGMLLDEIFAP